MGRLKKKDIAKKIETDEVIVELKDKFFQIYPNENIGKTPAITKTLDNIIALIEKRKQEITNEEI